MLELAISGKDGIIQEIPFSFLLVNWSSPDQPAPCAILCFIIKPTVKILKVGTPQTIAIIVQKLVKFDVTLH